ncbi:MAG: leucine-rich repeat domain-containing protein, partial [Clostridia bacterium]|nr:leucine-rich repeat domain-containing protein [Clostridia bacterium]
VIPEGVTRIGYSAFQNRDGITSVTIPDSVTVIERSAFEDCDGIETVVIGNGVTSIGIFAFNNCDNLTTLTLGEKVTTIEGSAFSECKKLESLTIPRSVTTIEDHAFKNCEGITELTFLDSPASIGFQSFAYCKNLVKVDLGDAITTIGECSFFNCSAITEIDIPDSVTSIEADAFCNGRALKKVTIGKGVTSIDDSSFLNGNSVTEYIVDPENNAYTNDEFGALFNKEMTDLFYYPLGNERTSYAIPDSVMRIRHGAFNSAINLESVTFGKGLKSIDHGAFHSCSSLKEVIIPDNVVSIGDAAFSYCDVLETVSVGNGVKYIGSFAFEYCNIENLTLGSSIQFIGDDAFAYSLKNGDIVIPVSVTELGARAFCESSSENITIGRGVTEIKEYAFASNYNLKTVTIPNTVKVISTGAFNGCSGITDVYYEGTQEMWDKLTVDSINSDLLNATIHFGNEELEEQPTPEEPVPPEDADPSKKCGDNLYWSYNEETSELTISGTGEMYDYTDYSDDNPVPWQDVSSDVKTITIGEGATSIGAYAFSDCYFATNVVIPDSVTIIGKSAFIDCDDLETITIGNGVKHIGDSAFSSCYNLTDITIPDSVTDIGQGVFSYCYHLTSITMGRNVLYISYGAFDSCESLTDIYFDGTLAEWYGIAVGRRNTAFLNATVHAKEQPLFEFGVTAQHIRNKFDMVYYPASFGFSMYDDTDIRYSDICADVADLAFGCDTEVVMKYIYDATTLDFVSVYEDFWEGSVEVLEHGSTGMTGEEGQEYNYIILKVNFIAVGYANDTAPYYLKFAVVEENFVNSDGTLRKVIDNVPYNEDQLCVWDAWDANGNSFDFSDTIKFKSSDYETSGHTYDDLLLEDDLIATDVAMPTVTFTPEHARKDDLAYYPCMYDSDVDYEEWVRSATGFKDSTTQIQIKVDYDSSTLELIDALPSKELYDLGGTVTIIETGDSYPDDPNYSNIKYAIVQLDFDALDFTEGCLFSLKFRVLQENFIDEDGRPIDLVNSFVADWVVTNNAGKSHDLRYYVSSSYLGFESYGSYEELVLADYEPFDPTLLSDVTEVTYVQQEDTRKTFTVKADGRKSMIQFIEPDGGTRTYDRYNKNVSITSYDSNGNVVSALSRDLAYEVWEIYSNMSVGVEINVRGKENGVWDEVKYTFTIEPYNPVVSMELSATAGKKGAVPATVVADEKTEKVMFKMPNNTSVTVSNYTTDENGNRVFTGKAWMNEDGLNEIRVYIRRDNVWKLVGTLEYTVK